MNDIMYILDIINLNLKIYAVLFLMFLYFRLYSRAEDVQFPIIIGILLLLVGFLINITILLPMQLYLYTYYSNIIINSLCFFVVTISTLSLGLATLFIFDKKYFIGELCTVAIINFVNCLISVLCVM